MVLACSHAAERDRDRFIVEARTVAGLKHPNIVSLHDVNEVNGHLFCTLEYVDGGSLADKLNGVPLSLWKAPHSLFTLSLTLQSADGRVIKHRGFQPANNFYSTPTAGEPTWVSKGGDWAPGGV